MKYYTPKETALLWGISTQLVRRYCKDGKVPRAILRDGNWLIPEGTRKPGAENDPVVELKPLAKKVVYQRNKNNHFGIYEYIQVNLAYSSNRMASNRLTRQQVEEIYRTNKIATAFEPMKVDDIIEVIEGGSAEIVANLLMLIPHTLKKLRDITPALASYNVEMTEVTGGTFWKAYTPEMIAGTEEFPAIKNLSDLPKMKQWFDPIDTTNPKLIKLAKALGPVWVRVSGTWATKTYYDFDGKGYAPEGYENRLTREQWENLIKFVDAVGGKLLISVANCEGLHAIEEPWNPSQAELIFDLSKELGHPIDAVEFVNEPNMMANTGMPKGCTPEHFRRDQDIFHKWVRENHPSTLIVGPSSVDSSIMRFGPDAAISGGGIADILGGCPTDDLLTGCTEKIDIFSYHCYNGNSERGAALLPSSHWPIEAAHTEEYLSVAGQCARGFIPFRDKYTQCDEMWVTEAGDAGCGGNTWSSTYLEVIRTLNELGDFATATNGIIFHNTLASSDYGWLKHGTFDPRPNYFAVLLWNMLMGTTVFDSGEPVREGAHVYCHSRKDGKEGCVYLIINNSMTDVTTVDIPNDAEIYALAGRDGMRSTVMTLNSKDLVLGENDELPDLSGKTVPAGKIEIAPGGCTFIVL